MQIQHFATGEVRVVTPRIGASGLVEAVYQGEACDLVGWRVLTLTSQEVERFPEFCAAAQSVWSVTIPDDAR